MRMQLAVPENSLVSPELYNELFTNHGTVVMFLVILPIFEGFAILLLPLLLGTRKCRSPDSAPSPSGPSCSGLLYYSSTLLQAVPNAGWFAYTPLSGLEFSPTWLWTSGCWGWGCRSRSRRSPPASRSSSGC